MKRLTLLPIALLGLFAACSDDRAVTAPEVEPNALLKGTADLVDDYALNPRPVHGAIFTTLPFGQAVNANVQYKRKIEVYLDGGPRNPNSLAAGLNDGLYVFQITDPAGKYLLSEDPARCRVVQVKGGVIVDLENPSSKDARGTVPADRIPGLSADFDTWDDTDPYPTTRGAKPGKPCHVESEESDGASLAGQHDTNEDSDGGGGATVQMMPFGTTPNAGGVYKAWMTPLAVYVEKHPNGVAGLDIIPKDLTGAAGKACPDFCAAADLGFKNPSRNNVKTDNFKVVESPPFIRISKVVDGKPYEGWPVTVYELVEGAWVGAGWRGTTATFAVPLGSDARLLACEAVLPGYKFVSATVGGESVTPVTGGTPPVPTDDGGDPALPIVCVNVPGFASGATIDVVFVNSPVEPKAKITITPQDGTNLLPYEHALTAKVEIDRDLGSGWELAPNGTPIAFKILSGPSGTLDPATCTTAGDTGACSTKLTSAAAGVHKIEASATVEGILVVTNGEAGSSLPATKVWVDARISINPPKDVNGIFEPHGLTGKVEIKIGDAAWANAPDGLQISFKILSGPGALDPASCTTAGGTGTCSTTLNSGVVGTTLVEASATVDQTTVPAVPAGQSIPLKTDGQGHNSGPAEKNWIAGTLVWEKHDASLPGNRIAGATFQVCRTRDYALSTGTFTALATPDCFVPDILDNDSRDADKTGGVFKLTGLRLGTYRVTETIAPPNYVPDLTPRTADVITDATVTLNPFVNNLNGRMTGGSGKVYLVDLDQYLTSGFTIHCDIRLSNNLEINWPGNKWHLEKESLSNVRCIDAPGVEPGQPDAPFDTFISEAVGSLNGVPGSKIWFTFVDAGEPGKTADRVSILIKDGSGKTVLALTNQPIRGNLQAHEDQPHRNR